MLKNKFNRMLIAAMILTVFTVLGCSKEELPPPDIDAELKKLGTAVKVESSTYNSSSNSVELTNVSINTIDTEALNTVSPEYKNLLTPIYAASEDTTITASKVIVAFEKGTHNPNKMVVENLRFQDNTSPLDFSTIKTVETTFLGNLDSFIKGTKEASLGINLKDIQASSSAGEKLSIKEARAKEILINNFFFSALNFNTFVEVDFNNFNNFTVKEFVLNEINLLSSDGNDLKVALFSVAEISQNRFKKVHTENIEMKTLDKVTTKLESLDLEEGLIPINDPLVGLNTLEFKNFVAKNFNIEEKSKKVISVAQIESTISFLEDSASVSTKIKDLNLDTKSVPLEFIPENILSLLGENLTFDLEADASVKPGDNKNYTGKNYLNISEKTFGRIELKLESVLNQNIGAGINPLDPFVAMPDYIKMLDLKIEDKKLSDFAVEIARNMFMLPGSGEELRDQVSTQISQAISALGNDSESSKKLTANLLDFIKNKGTIEIKINSGSSLLKTENLLPEALSGKDGATISSSYSK